MVRCFFIFLAALSLAACGSRAVSPGRAYYLQNNCRSCHRIGEEGRSAGPDLTYAGWRHNKEWLDFWLKDPSSWKKDALMPNPRLPPAVRAAIVEYLAQQQGQEFKTKPWADAPDPIAKGRLIYQRAGCIACHGPAGQGGLPNNNVPGGLIPALALTASTYTKEELVAKIGKGSRPQKADPGGAAPLVVMPAWKDKLDPDELSAVAAYLLSLPPSVSSKMDADW